MVSVSAITDAVNTEQPGRTRATTSRSSSTRHLHAVRALRRPLPDRVIVLGKLTRHAEGDPTTARTARLRLRRLLAGRGRSSWQRQRKQRSAAAAEGRQRAGKATRRSGVAGWHGHLPTRSVFRRGYTDSPRNRSYVIMNNVLYHLHPVKVKRHAVKVSYTLCLGGLSFFLFILLTGHRHLPDVLLPADGRVGVDDRADARDRGRRSGRSCATCIDGPRTSWC
jgi:hypothetical protein